MDWTCSKNGLGKDMKIFEGKPEGIRRKGRPRCR